MHGIFRLPVCSGRHQCRLYRELAGSFLVESIGMWACVVCVVATWLGAVKASGLKSYTCMKPSWLSSSGNLALQVVFETEF
mmetsp:Transcript_44447/g.141459  ORF Transcript_44447/g.141459 Transcript_44447/m.141459 type:complete len:81 (+) Transcript_44447:131-373(+)